MLLHFLKRFVLISCISIYSLSMFAQDFWEELNTPNGIHIYSIAVNDAGQIFLGAANDGAPGGVYRSSNNGASWDLVFDNGELQTNPIEISWYEDIFIGKRGFDQLMVSHDSGDTWDSLYFPGLGNISAIYSPGPDTLFVGFEQEGARLLRSYDNTMNWDTVFITSNSSEYILDILQTQSGDLYIALTGYFPDMGGVYKSSNGGDSWELSGLFNHMVSSLAENSEGDVFAGVRDIMHPGLYVLRNGEDEWEGLIVGPQVEDVVVNGVNHIYVSSSQVIRSLDNGQTFEYFEEGLFLGPKGFMTDDELGYLYLTSEFASNALYRTINSTVSIAEEYYLPSKNSLILYPNPVDERLFVGNLPDGPEYQYEVYIHNAQGMVVKQEQVFSRGSQLMIDVSVLPSGFYIISVIADCKRINGRFIKK